MGERLLRLGEVADRLGISKATVYRWLEGGRLPARRAIGENTVGILESELTEWLRSRPVVGTRPGGDVDEDADE